MGHREGFDLRVFGTIVAKSDSPPFALTMKLTVLVGLSCLGRASFAFHRKYASMK